MTSRKLICDWFAAYQEFSHDIPKLTDGMVISCDNDMTKIQWSSDKAFQHGGSYSTNIWVKSDGRRLSLSGNVGRFGRPDNVFGYDLDQCKLIANQILRSLDLPEFTPGKYIDLSRRDKKGELVTTIAYTGAHVTNFHLTENLIAGSETDARNFIYWVESQKPGRAEVTGYYGQTVYVGERSKYARRKIYDKAEAVAHELKKMSRKKIRDPEHIIYLRKLEQWCRDVGIIRHEVEFKSRYLTQNGLKFWEDCTHKRAVSHYEKYREQIMTRCESYTELSDLPAATRGVYHAYIAGEDLRDLPKSTLYRHRKLLLNIGVDILRPTNVRAIKLRPRVIELRPATIPDFYQLPRLREAS